MSKLKPVSWKELVRRMNELNFNGPYQGGKHPYMVRDDIVVTIPNPHKHEIGIDLLRRILSRAGIDRDEWLSS